MHALSSYVLATVKKNKGVKVKVMEHNYHKVTVATLCYDYYYSSRYCPGS